MKYFSMDNLIRLTKLNLQTHFTFSIICIITVVIVFAVVYRKDKQWAAKIKYLKSIGYIFSNSIYESMDLKDIEPIVRWQLHMSHPNGGHIYGDEIMINSLQNIKNYYK